MAEPAAGGERVDALPLFPLRTVLFPGGLLGLKVFEARYLDLMTRCLRTHEPFGVICLAQGVEAGSQPEAVRLETVGVLARIDAVDSEQQGILDVRCTGTQRFRLAQAAHQLGDGLWVAAVETCEDDPVVAPDAAHAGSVAALAQAAARLKEQGQAAIAEPLRLHDAGWVANRWCELLPITLAAKQKLMELDDPGVRLRLVDEFLRSKQVLKR